MTLIRAVHNKDNPFVIINKTIITDKRLSWKAKGIWLYAFSRPDDWTFHISDLIRQSTDSRDSIRSGLKELEDAGYFQKTQKRGSDGKMGSAEWLFLETPKTKEEIQKMLPETDFTSTVKPTTASHPLLNIESSKHLPTEDLKRRQQQGTPSSRVVVYPSLENLKLPQDLKEKLSKKYTAKEIDVAVTRVLAWETRDSDAAAILTVLEQADTWQDKENKEQIENKNKQFLEKELIRYDGKPLGPFQVHVGPDYMEFIAGGMGGGDRRLETSEKDFILLVSEFIKNLQ